MVRLIYAHHILTGTGTFETEPPSLDTVTERWGEIVAKGWPYLVASPRADLTRVLGFAYATQYRPRPGYLKTFEDSLYVAPGSERLGVGYQLLMNLIVTLKDDGVRELLAFTRSGARDAVRKGLTLEQTQKAIDFTDFIKRFGGDDVVRVESFTNFYAQPAVQRAYEEAKFESEGAIKSGGSG